MEKAFEMYGRFMGFSNWPLQVIELCRRFYRKYDRYPGFIRMNEATMEALFDENARAFNDIYSEEHVVTDSNGEQLIPLEVSADGSYKRPEKLNESDETFIDEYIQTHTHADEELFREKYEDVLEDEAEDSSDETEDEDDECSDDEPVYPMEFGVNDDCTVSFITNKFELKFLEGDDLPENFYVVQSGEGPDGGGEDFDEEEEGEMLPLVKLAA